MGSGYVKEYFYFRTDYKAGSDYDRYIRQLTSYIKLSKNKHDDAADATIGLATFAKTFINHKTEKINHYNWDFEKPELDYGELEEPDRSFIDYV